MRVFKGFLDCLPYCNSWVCDISIVSQRQVLEVEMNEWRLRFCQIRADAPSPQRILVSPFRGTELRVRPGRRGAKIKAGTRIEIYFGLNRSTTKSKNLLTTVKIPNSRLWKPTRNPDSPAPHQHPKVAQHGSHGWLRTLFFRGSS